jgi:hypothetical protein
LVNIIIGRDVVGQYNHNGWGCGWSSEAKEESEGTEGNERRGREVKDRKDSLI